MKKIKKISLLITILIGFASCRNEDDNSVQYIPTNQSLTALFDNALENKTQRITFDAETTFTFTSQNGVTLTINGNCLLKNGNVVTGNVDLEFVEIFDRGSMLVTNKPTMGLENGEKKLLTSGGEFYINVKQDDVQLTLNCGMLLSVPTSLTGGTDYDMLPFSGSINGNNELIWEQVITTEIWINSQESTTETYNIFYNSFGWFNCDKFITYPDEETTISTFVPQGYNSNNSFVFMTTNSFPNSLGTTNGKFPIGLEVSFIFVTEENGLFRYAIKSGETLAANHEVTFSLPETTLATEEELINAVNQL